MDQDSNPIAQGPQADAGSSATQAEAPVANEGFQKRIDELVAKHHDSERSINQLMSQNSELLAALARNQAAQAQAPQEQAPSIPEGLDPSIAQYFEHSVKKMQEPLLRHIQQLEGRVSQGQVQSQLGSVSVKLQKLNQPAVSARVEQLLKGWVNHPVFREATADDAYKIALGEYAEGQLTAQSAAAQSRNERGQFNSGSAVMGGHSGSGRPARQGVDVANLLNTADLNNISPMQLNKLLEEADRQNPDGIPLY